MQNSDVTPQVEFVVDDATMDITDGTDYAGQTIDPEDVTVYLKIEAPTGVLLNHLNTAATLGTVDIYPEESTAYDNTALPEDGDDIYPGVYEVTMQSRVWTAVDYAIDSNCAGEQDVVISGSHAADIAGGVWFRISGSTADDGIYEVTSASYDAGTGYTTVVLVGTIVGGLSGDGNFVVYTAYKDYSNTIEYTYGFEAPVVDIAIEHSCRYSTMTVTDESDYVATIAGEETAASSTTRTMTLTRPALSAFSPATTTTATNGISITGIYTGKWTVSVSTALVYAPVTDVTISYTAQAVEYHDVTCSDCVCTYLQCVKNLWDKYYEYKGTNDKRFAWVDRLLKEINYAYMLYLMAEACGEDTTEYCEKIQELAVADDCLCSESASAGVSVLVVPWGT